ncbi:MAG: ParB/RepB/Spo0J family partition protein [Candidatus Bruticola sp.]
MSADDSFLKQENYGGLEIIEISISDILQNPFQPRRCFNESALQELADSIRSNGVIQPIVVTKLPEGYRLVVGERRVKAAKMIGRRTIPAIVRSLSSQDMLELALVENLQRQDLNPIEEALALSFLVSEFRFSHYKLAERLGKSRSYITNSLRLLHLPEAIKEDLQNNILTGGHAKAVLSLEGESNQLKAWEYIKEEQLSVRKTEEYINALKGLTDSSKSLEESGNTKKTAYEKSAISPEWKDLLEKLRYSFGADIRLNSRSDGKGKLEFHFKNQEELERIVECFIYLMKS